VGSTELGAGIVLLIVSIAVAAVCGRSDEDKRSLGRPARNGQCQPDETLADLEARKPQ
jgi:hypothetical protein